MADIFGKEGLLATTAAREVLRKIVVGWEAKSRTYWTYRGGVWSEGTDEIGDAISNLLGEKYRDSHANAIHGRLRTLAQPIEIGADQRGTLVNFTNGSLDWKSLRLRRHDPKHGSTVQFTIPWSPKAVCPEFDRWLPQVVHTDDITRAWQMLGYLLVPGNWLHESLLFTGDGRNGKSVMLDLVMAIVGDDNCASIDPVQIAEDRFAAADLHGRHLNIVQEMDPGFIQRTATLKAAVAGGQITVQHKHVKAFRMRWHGKMAIATNHGFASSDSSGGMIGRLAVLNFPNCFKGREDFGLTDRLKRELPGVAAKAIRAIRDAPGLRFDPGHSHDVGIEQMTERSNPAAAWVADGRAILDPDAWTPRNDLWGAARVWAEVQNRKMTGPGFYDHLRRLQGVTEATRKGTRGFRGIRLPNRLQDDPS